jgi:hypothetical protein
LYQKDKKMAITAADAVQAAEYRRCTLNNTLVMKNNTVVLLRGGVASQAASSGNGTARSRSVVSKRPKMPIPAAGAVQPAEYRLEALNNTLVMENNTLVLI